jgi:adenine deaminase
MQIESNYIDLYHKEIYGAIVTVENGYVQSIERTTDEYDQYILPGFIDSHVHIESSLLIPSEFARMAVLHGTVATISDPHEIANVCGMEGVHFMIENGKLVPFHFFFGAPSCVPATIFETAGAALTAAEVGTLLAREDILYLSEMMNFPGVIDGDEEVLKKIALAKGLGKPVDGHAPGLRGESLEKYIQAGIYTDHECFTLAEAEEKVSLGMHILIREGSAARNYEALAPLLSSNPTQVMFCSDDKHPDSLINGHINKLVARALAEGYPLFDVLRSACINPVEYYKLPVGTLRINDPADFIIVNNLHDFEPTHTYIKGKLVATNGQSLIERQAVTPINCFNCKPKNVDEFKISCNEGVAKVRVIEALEGQLITHQMEASLLTQQGMLCSDVDQDILKIAVVNRYQNTPPALGFIKNFGLRKGAMASSVAHDSHNIIAVGCTDEELCMAVNDIIAHQGGLSVVYDNEKYILPLPVGGIMSDGDAWEVEKLYSIIDQKLKNELGSTLKAPYMTLSFMALLVIPALKLSDKGLFDGQHFQFTTTVIDA